MPLDYHPFHGLSRFYLLVILAFTFRILAFSTVIGYWFLRISLAFCIFYSPCITWYVFYRNLTHVITSLIPSPPPLFHRDPFFRFSFHPELPLSHCFCWIVTLSSLDVDDHSSCILHSFVQTR